MKPFETIDKLITMKIVCLFLCLMVLSVSAENHIITLTVETQTDIIEISPIINFKSSQAIKEAIDNGVRINLIAKAQLYTPNRFWFDNIIDNQKQVLEIYYFKLGRLYVAKNLTTNNQISVNDYEDIWKKFEEIISFKFDKSQINSSWIRMRVMLDTSALPTTMQLPVLFNNEWDINTQWQSQKIQTEKKTNE